MFVFPGYAMDQSRIDMEEVDTKLRDGNLDRVIPSMSKGMVKAPCMRT